MMKQIIALVIIIAAVLSGLWYVLPQYYLTQSLKERITVLDDALTTAKKVNELSAQLKTSLKSVPPDKQTAIDSILPAKIDELALGNDIRGIALRHGMILKSFSVRTAPVDNKNKKTTPYDYKVVSITASAPYQNLVPFLESLEQSVELFDIQEVVVIPHDIGSYDYTIKFRTYEMKQSS